jgi:CheY-like chemotaxis protein
VEKKQVLVVDDDVVILRLVRESLTALLGCEVDTTPSPEYAFEMVLRKQYDLMLFDYLIPGVDGPTLYSLLSKVYAIQPSAGRKLPPLILMSGYAAQKKAQEFLREPGVRGLLAKPFSIERLVEKVGALLG